MITAEENEPQPLRIIGVPKRRDGKYVLDEFAILDKECGWICPRCNEEVRIWPTQAGEQTFMCKRCNASFTVRVDAEATTFLVKKKKPTGTAVIDSAGAVGVAAAGAAGILAVQHEEQKPARGVLLMSDEPDDNNDVDNRTVISQHPNDIGSSQQESTGSLQWGGFFSRKHYQLHVGSNVIGRKDKKNPSDVEFDDPEMSRRSAKVEVIPNEQGEYSFIFTLIKSLNAVKVNDKQLNPGEEILLKHNDVIVMGKTTITFKCSK